MSSQQDVFACMRVARAMHFFPGSIVQEHSGFLECPLCTMLSLRETRAGQPNSRFHRVVSQTDGQMAGSFQPF